MPTQLTTVGLYWFVVGGSESGTEHSYTMWDVLTGLVGECLAKKTPTTGGRYLPYVSYLRGRPASKVYLAYTRPCIRPSYTYAYAALALTSAGVLIGREAAKAIHSLIQRKACSLSTLEPTDANCRAISTAITAR